MNQSSAIDVSAPINIDTAAKQRRQSQSSCHEFGLSPTYYTSEGIIQPNTNNADEVGSPVFNDRSRVFFSHNQRCSCRGSGVGCDCTKSCAC
ncbi:hypothetical protein BY458DRAFT_475863 [Sporodiniella umbellata]|nr:hypothetical protein BY458DRAFT_475863 [Sporodiniella umbellata]